jgi:hypothetical protein
MNTKHHSITIPAKKTGTPIFFLKKKRRRAEAPGTNRRGRATADSRRMKHAAAPEGLPLHMHTGAGGVAGLGAG